MGTRLAASLYGFEPDYEKIVISLSSSGTQGLQLALLAPGWVHGCLGLWLRFRHHDFMRRAKPALLALLIGLPLLSAAGFMHMTRTVEAANAHLPAPADPTLFVHRVALDDWRRNLLTLYACLVIGAVGAGLLRNRLQSTRAPKSG